MINAKRLITSFFIANAVDSLITFYFLNQEGWQELNLVAVGKISRGEFYEVLILKTAVTAILIGTYALAKTINSRLEYPLERSVQIGTMLIWIVQVWNAFNVIASFTPQA